MTLKTGTLTHHFSCRTLCPQTSLEPPTCNSWDDGTVCTGRTGEDMHQTHVDLYMQTHVELYIQTHADLYIQNMCKCLTVN